MNALRLLYNRCAAASGPPSFVVARYVCYARVCVCVCARRASACAGRWRAVPIQEPVGSSPINAANNRRPFIPEDAHPSAYTHAHADGL